MTVDERSSLRGRCEAVRRQSALLRAETQLLLGILQAARADSRGDSEMMDEPTTPGSGKDVQAELIERDFVLAVIRG